jgi:hypothetical protein
MCSLVVKERVNLHVMNPAPAAAAQNVNMSTAFALVACMRRMQTWAPDAHHLLHLICS